MNKNFKRRSKTFRIEKIINQQGNRSLVKWLGYHDSFSTWVDNKDIKDKLYTFPLSGLLVAI